MNERLKKLEAERDQGLTLINDYNQQLSTLKVNVFRIEGAITILKELIAEAQDTETDVSND